MEATMTAREYADQSRRVRVEKRRNVPRFMMHERLSRLLVGIVILSGLAIGRWVTPWGYLVLVAAALNLIQFAFTGRCMGKTLFDHLGIPYEHLSDNEEAGVRQS